MTLTALRDPWTLSIIVPVFNERDTLAELIRNLPQLTSQQQVLIVDDGSTDGTAALVQQLGEQPGVRALFHARNLGKGAAVRTALREATGELIVIQDADLEYDPNDIATLTAPILEGRADVVFGSRFQPGSRATCGRTRRSANRVLTLLSNCFSGLRLTDMETGYKAFRREALERVILREKRFGFEPEVTAKIARGGWRIVEVPVHYTARSRADGKKIKYRDGLLAIYCIVRYSWFD